MSASYPLVRNRNACSTRFGVLRSPSRVGSSPSSASSRLIKSCIALLFYLPLFEAPATAQGADQLYADRANLASARKAADAWKADLARDPHNFEAAWKLARADYWLGGHAAPTDARAIYESGIKAARTAVTLQGDRAEGHFWMAANMGALAESGGMREGLKYRDDIKWELEKVLRIDPGFQQGSADRALGRWYFKVPRLLGGSHREAEAHLRKSLKYNANSTASHFFLAELLIADGRKDEARTELEGVLAVPDHDPVWGPENDEFKVQARTLLARLRSRK